VRRLATLLALCAACGGGAGGAPGPEMPDNASEGDAARGATPAVGYFAAGTIGQNPETGALEFTGNPLAVAWVEGALRPLAGPVDLDAAVGAFRDAHLVSGIDGNGKPVRVTIGPSDPPSQGMFTMRLGGAVEGAADGRTALLAVPGVTLESVTRAAATVPDATAQEQSRRLRAALQARPPHDECGDNTYDLVEDVGAASGTRVGEGAGLAVGYKVTVNSRARSSTGEALSALFVGADSSVEPPYLGLCRDHPAWRADPELAARIDGRLIVLLVLSACGCEQEDWQLIPVS